MSLISLGDGSTLSLDFTAMSSLDSRFTFTRSSDATFINSSGLVQWANANIVRRSEDCTNWGGAQNITPTADAAIAPNGTQTADQLNLLSTSYKYQQTAANKVIGGQRYTGSIYVRAVSGTVQVNLRIVNTADGNNGVAVTQTVGETWTRLQGSFTLASNGTLIDIGLDQRTGIPNAGPGVAANVYVWGLQLQPGGIAGEYLQTTTTENYNTPRFDYDPTTLAPRGLLIEGSATNLCTYSEDFSNAAWTKSGTNGSMTLTGTAPDNNATSRLLEENTTSYAKHSLERSITISAGIHTLSVWLKEPSANSRRYAHIQLADGQATAARYTIVVDVQTGQIVASGANNGTAGAPTGTGHSITAYPGGWYRVTISMNHVASPCYPVIMLGDSASLFGGNNQPFYSATTPYKSLIVWGAQLETGSGASSYIPTGSSTVQRAADSCSMTGTNFSSWYGSPTAFSMLFEGIAQISANYGRVLCLSSGANTTSGIPNLNLGLSAATSNRPFINAYIVSNNNIDLYAPAGAALTNDVPFKIGVRHQTSSHYITRGASLSATNSYAGFAAGLANLYFGNTDGIAHRAVHYTRLKFWPVALSNAQLDSFAT